MQEFVSYRGTTYPWQCDHMGHINVMWYMSKFDEATWQFFASFGITPTYLRGDFAMAAVQQNITYKRELMPGDIIEIRSTIVEVRDKVIRYIHDMRNVEQDLCAAICDVTTVHMDRRTRRACAMPDDIKARAERLVAKAQAMERAE